MSGFFAIRRSTLEKADLLNPIGYKIGLELMAKCHVARVVEVPITFHKRLHGQPKLNSKRAIPLSGTSFAYNRLYDYQYPKVSPGLEVFDGRGTRCGGLHWGPSHYWMRRIICLPFHWPPGWGQ